ncbi:MAG: hypothetical protein R6V61_12170 [Wenzhouxiangellaceae bacterium]
MKQALSAWIAQDEERDRLTHEALADVDAGNVIDHQAAQTWADSLSTEEPLPRRTAGITRFRLDFLAIRLLCTLHHLAPRFFLLV